MIRHSRRQRQLGGLPGRGEPNRGDAREAAEGDEAANESEKDRNGSESDHGVADFVYFAEAEQFLFVAGPAIFPLFDLDEDRGPVGAEKREEQHEACGLSGSSGRDQ